MQKVSDKRTFGVEERSDEVKKKWPGEASPPPPVIANKFKGGLCKDQKVLL